MSDLAGELFLPIRQTWDQLRKGPFAPGWSVNDLLLYPANALPYFAVVGVTNATKRFTYLFWGTGHVDVKGIDYTGKAPIDHQPEEHGRAIDREYQMVVEQRRPLAFVHDIRPQSNLNSLFQECLRMPLSTDGEQVTHVLSYSDWQTESQKWKRIFKTG